MNPADIRNELREAVRLHRAGDTETAKNIIRGVLRQHPDSADAWYAASIIASSIAQKKKNLERALENDPGHKAARTALDRLEGRGGPPAQKPSRKADGGNRWLVFAGVGVAVAAVAVVGALLLLSGPAEVEPPAAGEDGEVIEFPTLAPTFTPTLTETVGPSPTPEPTSTPEPSVTPTPSNTPQPFGQTATVQLFNSQTDQAILYEVGTAAAGQ